MLLPMQGRRSGSRGEIVNRNSVTKEELHCPLPCRVMQNCDYWMQ